MEFSTFTLDFFAFKFICEDYMPLLAELVKYSEINKSVIKVQKSQLPIGVFDSGMGGLTVLKELKALLPNESLIYLGDTARLPYGTKSIDTVKRYAKQMADVLVEQNIKMLVVACNTATTAALDFLRVSFPDLPVIGVVEPGAVTAANTTKANEILVLATETTVNSDVYAKTIKQVNAKISVMNQACGLFVAIAEEGCVHDEIAMCVIAKYLQPVLNSKMDCIVLGCTHFPVLKNAIQEYVGNKIQIVDSALATAKEVVKILQQGNLQAKETLPSYRFLVTDLPKRFSEHAQIFFGEAIDFHKIEKV